jgi:hypothetical protein
MRKFFASASSVEFMVRPLVFMIDVFMMTMEHANRLPPG